MRERYNVPGWPELGDLTPHEGAGFLALVRRALAYGIMTRCESCGESFVAHSVEARYCSANCRKLASKRRISEYYRGRPHRARATAEEK